MSHEQELSDLRAHLAETAKAARALAQMRWDLISTAVNVATGSSLDSQTAKGRWRFFLRNQGKNSRDRRKNQP